MAFQMQMLNLGGVVDIDCRQPAFCAAWGYLSSRANCRPFFTESLRLPANLSSRTTVTAAGPGAIAKSRGWLKRFADGCGARASAKGIWLLSGRRAAPDGSRHCGPRSFMALFWRRWILFLIANVSFGSGVVIYNSFLPEIAPREDRDRVSSKGWAAGYVGGGLLLALNLLLYLNASRLGIDEGMAVRISLASAGVRWAVFTVPPLLPKLSAGAHIHGRVSALQRRHPDRHRAGVSVWPFFGLALQFTKSCRVAILSLIVFFLGGLVVLLKVNVQRGEKDVERSMAAGLH